MTDNTVRLHRVLRAKPEAVYRAFVEADALVRWLPPRGYTAKVDEMAAKAGGKYRMSFTDFATGNSHFFGGNYLELTPGKRIRYSARFDDPALAGEMQTSITLTKVPNGTDISIVQEGIPELIPLDDCYLGWQDSLMFLALLVEGGAETEKEK